PPGGRDGAVPLLRAVRALVVRLQDVPVRPPARSPGRRARRSLHAPAGGLQEAGELRGVLLSAARVLCAGGRGPAPGLRVRADLAPVAPGGGLGTDARPADPRPAAPGGPRADGADAGRRSGGDGGA